MSNYIGKNLTKLPPGVRFHPTDEEILFEYLRCKVFRLPLPASVIPQVDFLNFDPWDLPGNSDERRYFYWKKDSQNRKQKKRQRVTHSGYWKAIGTAKEIFAPPNQNMGGIVIQGFRKSFVFYQGNKAPKGRRTDWFMHEYCLDFNVNCNVNYNVEDWVICNVFLNQNGEEVDDSSSVHEDECSDNIYSTTNNSMNIGPSTYYCPSPASSSTSVYKVSPSYDSNYGEANSYSP